MSALPIIDVPADPAGVAGFKRWLEYQERRRALLIRRQVHWRVRKYTPGLAIEQEQRLWEAIQAAARRYHDSAPGGR